MDKNRAIALFGERKDAAAALQCTPQAVSSWPDPLPLRIADRVVGAAVRLGKPVPAELLAESGRIGRQTA